MMRLLVVFALAWLSVVTGFSIASAPLRGRARALAARSGRPEAAVRDITSNDEFDEAIKSAGDSLVVVDYSTSWCGPCKIIAPKFDEFSEQYKNVAFLKVSALPRLCTRTCPAIASPPRLHSDRTEAPPALAVPCPRTLVQRSLRCPPVNGRPLVAALPCVTLPPLTCDLRDQVMGDSSPAADKLMRSQGVRALPSFHFVRREPATNAATSRPL